MTSSSTNSLTIHSSRHHHTIILILKVLHVYKSSGSPGTPFAVIGGSLWGVKHRLLVSIDKSKSVEEAHENVDLARALHEGGSMYVVGVDLGGNPFRTTFVTLKVLSSRPAMLGSS